MNDIPKLLEETAERSATHQGAREEARRECVGAIRRLEGALVGALAGEKLRGLSNVAPHPGDRLYAAILRGKFGSLQLSKDPLVLLPDGRLAMVREGLDVQHAVDADLFAEDVELFARTVEAVLTEHLRGMVGSTARYERLSGIGLRLMALLADLEPQNPGVPSSETPVCTCGGGSAWCPVHNPL
jgi:hypothetical protein